MSESYTFEIQESYQGTVKRVAKAAELGGRGNFEVAVVDLLKGGEAWYPLNSDHSLASGFEVTITPQVRHHPSGGSSTSYSLERTLQEVVPNREGSLIIQAQ